MTNRRGRKTIVFRCVAAATVVLALFSGRTSAQEVQDEDVRKLTEGFFTGQTLAEQEQVIELGPGSAHPGTTGEVRLELEEFLMAGDPRTHGHIWDLAVDEEKGELYVLSDPRRVRGVEELKVYNRSGEHLRTIMPFNPILRRSSVWDISSKNAREGGTDLVIPEFSLAWGDPSFYGSTWDFHKKLALVPDGDLIMADIYHGTLVSMGRDGSLPEEAWNTARNTRRKGLRPSNYLIQCTVAAMLLLALVAGPAAAEESGKPVIELGPGSAHPGTTGEVKLELEDIFLDGDPHAYGFVWDIAIDEKKGEVYVMCEPRRVRGVGEVRVFDRHGAYLRTIMPFNPALTSDSMDDISQAVVREGGSEFAVPELDLSWGDVNFYGTFWDSQKKIALAPDGDLIITDIYRGRLMKIGTDGSLPETGWSSGKAVHVGGARGSAIMNHLPFDSLRYPYYHFGSDGSLYISGGQSNYETRYYHYNLEGGVNKPKYDFPIEGDRSGYVWKMSLKDGPQVEKLGVVGGFHQASGIVVDGENIIVADAGNSRIQVVTIDGEVVASITHYTDQKGEKQPILDPTALVMDREGCLYVLVGSEKRGEDPRTEGGIRQVQRWLHQVATSTPLAPPSSAANADTPPPPPRKLIKLKSWKKPELLAERAPVYAHTLQIAVDAGVTPPLVWVANGDGPGTLQQLSGDDLSLKNQWQDDGSTLSNPRQDGKMAVLNVDPETGHVYVEDDASYRSKTFGTVYRLNQEGEVLKTWDPYFIDIEESGLISPWGAINLERGFRYPEEHLFIDSVFGKDGRIYRWKLHDDGVSILRFDREGEPVPFESTGTNEILVDDIPITGRAYKNAHLNKQLTCWWDIYVGMNVDAEGNIYYAGKQKRYIEQDMILSRYGLYRSIDVYDATGKLKQEATLNLTSVMGIEVDAEGHLYILHIPSDGREPEKPIARKVAGKPRRLPMRPFVLSKFAPTGGEPIWSRPWSGNQGMGLLPPNPHCICSTHRINQALDEKGYIYVANKFSVQVVDTETGELVGEFGTYGNTDCKGKDSAYPNPELPFGAISSLVVWKDKLFVLDVINRRLVKCNITYDPALKSAK